MDIVKSNTILIEPNKPLIGYWKEVWTYRELFAFLAWRDILVRYKQTVIGIAWSVLRPLITTVVLTIVFGKIAGLSSDGIPYPILVYSAILPWNFFANSLNDISNSLVGNAGLLTKVYFPRFVIPASTVVVNVVDTIIAFVILFAIFIWYRFIPGINIIFIPLFILIIIALVLGVGLWISALNVKYRDFRFIVPFAIQFGLYISPVGFSSSTVPENLRLIYSLNPLVGVIDGFRWAILGGNHQLNIVSLLISIVMACTLLGFGIWYFRKTEREFADVV